MAARLETDEHQRRTLLADVSHELRTPLAVVPGNLEAILDGVHPADAEHLARRSSTRPGSSAGSSTTSGRWPCPRPARSPSTASRPTPTCSSATSSVLRDRGGGRGGVDLTAAIEGDLPLLDVDPVRIREVLANLVANALRHTPAGGRVTVDCSPPNRPLAPARGRATPAPASSRRCSPTSSTGS